MDEEWSWKDLTTIAPIVASAASAFAFAFVVGYFSAFDITWIPFFSLSEHVVLALRALPVAIAACVALQLIQKYPGWLRSKWLLLGWFACLLVAAVGSALGLHIGLGVSFLLMAVSTFVYYKTPPPPKSTADLLFWASNLWVLTLVIGFASGGAWIWGQLLDLSLPGLVDVELKHQSGCEKMPETRPVFGHLIAAGNKAVLLYDFSERKVRLIERGDICGIAERKRGEISSAER